MYDALVVGAGPAGSNISYELSRKGFRVKIIDLKERIGIPNHCSGLVDRRVVDMVGEDLVVGKPASAEVTTPLGSFTLKSDRMRVIDRVALDVKLADMAQSEGAELALRTSLTEFHQSGGRTVSLLKSRKGYEKVESRFIIGADGPASTVRRGLGIRSPRLLSSIQYDVARKSEEVKIYLDRTRTPDFFSWEVPNGDEVEIGASGARSEEVVRGIAGSERVIRKRGGLIPLGPTELGKGGGFLIGDAAGLSKATTGGGLYAALNSGITLSRAIEKGEDVLGDYQKNWQRSFGQEISRDFKIRQLLDRYEKHYWLWVPMVSSSISGVNRVGDVDYPSRALLYILFSFPFRIPSALTDFISRSVRI